MDARPASLLTILTILKIPLLSPWNRKSARYSLLKILTILRNDLASDPRYEGALAGPGISCLLPRREFVAIAFSATNRGIDSRRLDIGMA